MAWQPPSNPFQRYPNLKVIFSIGAGVDQFDCESFPNHVRLVRMLDPSITQGMVEYATLAVLSLHRHLPHYLIAQRQAAWQPVPWTPASQCTVGILGLGHLGQAVATQLSYLGFQVAGWNRTHREINGIRCFSGPEERAAFLAETDILICLLPLTDSTRGILNRDLFYQLPRGAKLINAARGAHLNEQDLLQALDEGQLSVAMLDVVEQEPPLKEHPFWQHPGIIMTPHIAATTQKDSGFDVLLENIRRHRAGKQMLGEVDLNRGY